MTQQKRLRRLAILAAGAVASTALVGVAGTAPAQAAPIAVSNVSLTWGFSAASNSWGVTTTGNVAPTNPQDGTSTSGPFVKAEGFTLTKGAGSVDPTVGGSVDFTGSVTYSPFASYGTLVADKSTVTFADFELDVLSASEGKLTADVSYHKPEGNLPATRLTVATFDITSLAVTGTSLNLQSAAPDWANTVAAGTYSGSYTDAWPAELVKALRTTVSTPSNQDLSVYFFRTGDTAGNTAKAPLALSASAAKPTVLATPSYADKSVSIKVDGAGFTGTDGNPGDDGVYVGLAPAGGLPSTATQADMDKFAAAQWIPAASVKDGAISTTLTATAAVLKQGTAYSVYTWRAHSHSTTTQDTETPVTIDWSKLTVTPATPTKAATKVTAKVTKKPTTAKGGTLSIGLKGTGGKPAGKVTVKLTSKGKKAVTKTAKAKNGKAVVKLPKLKAGSWKATVVYAGSGDFKAAKDVVTFKVKKSKKKK